MTSNKRHNRTVVRLVVLLSCLLGGARTAAAHLLATNAMDVVVSLGRITVDARISMSEVLAVEATDRQAAEHDQWPQRVAAHRGYLVNHLHLSVDGRPVAAGTVSAGRLAEVGVGREMAFYHLEYPLPGPPGEVRIEQDCLTEYEPSDAAFVLRIRQDDHPVFETDELHRGGRAEFACAWAATAAPPVAADQTHVSVGRVAKAFAEQGVWHILTGYDHLLFVAAVTLSAKSVVELVKLVAAFTVAHTVTLTLSVLNVVTLSSSVVEPMISASIMVVAAGNILWPRHRSAWPRLSAAFGFGLFHGLGFAGGLRDAMAELPSLGLWTALIAFSVGVELGHQAVVLPLYAALRSVRRRAPSPSAVTERIAFWGSCCICAGGGYFLSVALTQPS